MITAIDLFAGLGGFTEGAQSLGVPVVWAANHWPEAVQVHAANHPDTDHVCQDLHQADWSRVPSHNLLLASPSCQGHARARGKDRPGHNAARSTAWAVVACAECHRPDAIVMENVPEFARWSLFPSWEDAMRRLGYHGQIIIADAAWFGVPQNRLRMFWIGTLDKVEPIVMPKADGPPARSIIDFATGSWSCVRKPGRAAATIKRFEHGRRTFGDRFVFSYYGNTKTSRSLDRPIGTITTRDRWAAVDGDRMRMLSVDECRRAMAFPDDYQLPASRTQAVHMLGNAVPPPMAAMVIESVLVGMGVMA